MTEYARSDVKVLDLTRSIAGPFCTKLLAIQGAEVIKVERPGEGDPSRRAGPFPGDVPDPEKSGLFLYLNTSKKSITLDLKSPTGVAILKELVKDADVLVENFTPRVMPSLGLSYEALREINPRLVMTSISNFGQTGPYRDYRAQDIVITAMGGLNFTAAGGPPGQDPVRPGGSQAQYVTGLSAYVATSIALFGAHLQGEGQHVDVSLFDTIAANLEMIDIVYSHTGAIWGTGWYRYATGHPIDVYHAKDGPFLLSTQSPGGVGMDMLALLVDNPELAAHPLFDRVDPTARMSASFEEFDALLTPYFETHKRLEIVEKAQSLGHLPFSLVENTEDLLNDPQMKARGFFVEVDHPKAGLLRYPGVPWVMSECEPQLAPAPLLGEHNEEILCGRLGLSKTDLGSLRAAGCI